MDEFQSDLSAVLLALEQARPPLVAAVQELRDGDLAVGRRGAWNVAQVLDHIIDSEFGYAAGIRALRGEPQRPPQGSPRETIPDYLAAFEASRAEVLAAVEGLDEETFYRMGSLHGQSYSVMSVLENVALHDGEHLAQIQQLVETARAKP